MRPPSGQSQTKGFNSKVWISLPTSLKHSIEGMASYLGLSMSEFCRTALFSIYLMISEGGEENLQTNYTRESKLKRFTMKENSK